MSHHPPHIYLDDTWYIITASTLNHARHLASDRAKILLRDQLKALVAKFGITLKAWVILDNHYHLLMKTNIGNDLSRFFSRLHGRTSFQFNNWDKQRGRQIWHNYWDTCIRNEYGLWTRFNYIHMNPVKHGYVRDMTEWPYSSVHYYLRHHGMDWLTDSLRDYPVLDYLEGDDF